MRTRIILMSVLLAIAAVSVNAAVVYEGFDYTEGTVITGLGTATDGWAGAWTVAGSNYHEVTAGLNLAGVQVSGGAATRPKRDSKSAMSRQISAAAQAALTADNTTTWFSVLMNPVGNGDGFAYNSYGTLIFGDAELTEGVAYNAAPISAGGNAIGVSYAGYDDAEGYWEGMLIQGVTYKAGTLTENTAQRTLAGAGTVMIVGRVDWAANGTDDVVSLYFVDDPAVTLPEEPFSTMLVDLDQSTFNVVSIGDAQTSIFDEIRFGTSYEEVGPLVDAGPDMLSWSGGEVQLAPTDTLDSTTLNYNWTADLTTSVTATFNPSATDPAPAVTFTKNAYANATIANASFEDPALGDNGTTANNDVPGWVAKNAYVWDPNTLYGGIAPEGENVVRVNNSYDGTDKYVYQVVDETIQAGATYTLNVSLGVDYVTVTPAFDPNSTDPNSTDYKVELLAGSDYDNAVVLVGEAGTYSDINNYKEVSVEYTYNEATDEALIGMPLQVRLTCVYGDDGSERGAIFDNVELTSTPLFPAPSVATAGVTVTVDDGVNPPLSDSLTVDIYDDECSMTLEGLNAAGSQTDLNGDCLTNLGDLAILAKNWLNSYAYDTPQTKP